MSQSRKVIAKDADLAMIQCVGNHQAPLFGVYLCGNAENNAVEKDKKQCKQMQKPCRVW